MLDKYEIAELHLIKLMNELADVLEHEVDVVERRVFTDYDKLVGQKQRLLMDYHAELKALSQQPHQAKNLPAAQKSMLRAAGEKLRDASARNTAVLRGAMVATQKLVQGIVSAVRDETRLAQGYQHLASPLPPSSTPPVAINTTV